ncbi:phage tail assembly chaperone [Aestuariivirga sp.]|uniref:phage tail assembly chaperone n=1 Tax=Aestuariivirga sp. TaxID=2650926 RepID=UPI0025BBD70E|nr:phage tail assembly chaperone [Aestuariivirga sp.]MCA3555307.1 phage tail assembly chaperone [Aestuariivirga sp.]
MKFPWEKMMATGLGTLRLSPRDFWAATPREIAAAFPKRQPGALPRDVLERLLEQFPDDT